MAADTTATTTQTAQTAVDVTWGSSIKRFRIDTQQKEWLQQIVKNLKAIQAGFGGGTQSVKVSFEASYPPFEQGGAEQNTSRTSVEISTKFEADARSQSQDLLFQDAFLFPTDALSYLETVISTLKSAYFETQEEIPHLKGYEKTIDIVVVPGTSSYFSERFALEDKKSQIIELVGQLLEFCQEKLGDSETGVKVAPEVLATFRTEIEDNPLKSWDKEISELGNLAGVKALAGAFVAAEPGSSELQIGSQVVAILELKQVFDLFQHALNEKIVKKGTYEYEGKQYAVAGRLVSTEIDKIEKEAFSFHVLNDSGDLLAQTLGDPSISSAGGEDRSKIEAFLRFFGSGERGLGDANRKTPVAEIDDETEVVKKLRGKAVRPQTETAAATAEETDDTGGDSEEEPEKAPEGRTLTLDEALNETTTFLTQRVFDALNFTAALEGEDNRILLEQLVKENLERLITLQFGDVITEPLQNEAIREPFYDQGLYVANPAFFKWQSELAAAMLASILSTLQGGATTDQFVASQIAAAQELLGTVLGTEPTLPDALTNTVVPENLQALVEDYQKAHPTEATAFDAAQLSNWQSLSWEQRQALFPNLTRDLARQTVLLSDTVILSALASYGLQDLDARLLNLDPASQQLVQTAIREAFLSLSPQEWLLIQKDSTVPLFIYSKILKQVVPQLTAENSTFEQHLNRFLATQLQKQGSTQSLQIILKEYGLTSAPDLAEDEIRQRFTQLQNEASELTTAYISSLSTRQLAELYARHNYQDLTTTIHTQLQAKIRAFSLQYFSTSREKLIEKIRALGIGLDADGHLAITEALVTVLGQESLAFVDVATPSQLSEILGISLGSLNEQDLAALRAYLKEYLELNLKRRTALLGKESTAFLPFSAEQFVAGETAITRANLRSLGRGHQKYGDSFTMATQLSDEEIEAQGELNLGQEQISAVQQLKHQLFLQTFSLKEGQTPDFLAYGFSEEDALYFQDPAIWSTVPLASLINYQAQVLGPEQTLPPATQKRSALSRLGKRMGLGRKAPQALFNKASTAALNLAMPGYSGLYKAGEMLLGKENAQKLQMALIYGGVGGFISTALIIASSSLAQAGAVMGGVAGSVIPGLGTVAGGLGGAWAGFALEKGLTSSAAGAGATSSSIGVTGSTAGGITGGGLFANISGATMASAGVFVATGAVVTTLVLQNSLQIDVPLGNIQSAERPDLEVIKTASPARGVGPNQDVTYTLVVKTNIEAGQTITGITLTDTLDPNKFDPNSLALQASTGANCTVAGGGFECAVDDLASGNQATITYSVRTSGAMSSDGSTPASNTATARGLLDGVEVTDSTTRTLNSSGDQIADASYDLLSGLQKGWWNYYNYHPSYPNLFNFGAWQTQTGTSTPPWTGSGRTFSCSSYGYSGPYPCIETRAATDLFWCTWNVIKTFEAVGQPIPNSLTGVTGMRNYFKNNGYYKGTDQGGTPTLNDVEVGDVAFFGKPGDFDAHVAIVGEKTARSIVTYDSNNYRIDVTYQVVGTRIEPNGTVQLNGIARLN